MAETKEHKIAAPEAGQGKRPGKATEKVCENMTYAAREAFKRLRENVVLSFPAEETCKVIGVTSAQPSEGKSTVSINLAYSLAELGKKVIVVDGDMRRPSIREKLGITQTIGLADLLMGEDNVGAAVCRYKSKTNETFLDVLTSGFHPQNPSELLGSKRAEHLLKILSSAYDYIILDLPPVNVVVDALTAARLTDGMLVVIRENNCPRNVLAESIEQLNYAKANILGFVVNGSVEGAGKRYQYNNYSRYY